MGCAAGNTAVFLYQPPPPSFSSTSTANYSLLITSPLRNLRTCKPLPLIRDSIRRRRQRKVVETETPWQRERQCFKINFPCSLKRHRFPNLILHHSLAWYTSLLHLMRRERQLVIMKTPCLRLGVEEEWSRWRIMPRMSSSLLIKCRHGNSSVSFHHYYYIISIHHQLTCLPSLTEVPIQCPKWPLLTPPLNLCPIQYITSAISEEGKAWFLNIRFFFFFFPVF